MEKKFEKGQKAYLVELKPHKSITGEKRIKETIILAIGTKYITTSRKIRFDKKDFLEVSAYAPMWKFFPNYDDALAYIIREEKESEATDLISSFFYKKRKMSDSDLDALIEILKRYQ